MSAKSTPDTKIEDLPFSKGCKSKLQALGLETVKDLANTDYTIILDAIGQSLGKLVLQEITSAGLKPTLQSPIWTEGQWRDFVESLVGNEIVDWKEVALAICGELNPPQVGTAVASNPSFQAHFKPRQTMTNVMKWFYEQDGRCAVCGTRLFLEADHIKSKQEFREEGLPETDADTLANLQLLCKRCNVIKRSSHVLGGLSFGPAQSVLMWIILSERPKTKAEFDRLCRGHGLTMASVRFDEAWAFAIWLNRQGKYELSEKVAPVSAALESLKP